MVSAKRGRPAKLPEIQLPVFVRVHVDDYELFPGHNDKGLDHNFQPGVTVVAGVNGVGKTTLLNIMLRLLVGPFNPEKVTPFEIGARSHSLVPWKQRNYFRARVSDDAITATASAEVHIGAHVLHVRRKLSDLSIDFLQFNGEELEPTEDEFVRVTLQASNVATRYDFDFLVRYLVFFLEQRVPLFWNERGQIETFRILLCEAELASAFQEKQDDLQTRDSAYRNLRWQANKRKKKLDQQKAAYAASSTVGARVAAVQEQFRALAETDRALVKAIEECATERSDLKTKLLIAKIELEQVQEAYEALQYQALAALFPRTAESARYIFSGLLSEKGCGVCGNLSRRGHERLTELLARGDCPVCESVPAQQEQPVGTPPVDSKALESAARALARQKAVVRAFEFSEGKSADRLKELLGARNANELSWNEVREELTKLNARMPVAPEELKQLESVVQEDDRQLSVMAAKLQRIYAEYEGLVALVDQRVQSIAESVMGHFADYAGSFLAERCQLGLARHKENVGQERQFEYPCFNVYMTSATSPDRETPRADQDDVSESQREFIDLAFRMAMIAAIRTKRSRAMLIIETPEASLDAYFVDQAGALLRRFGAEGAPGQPGNVVVVSSNVNRQNMIAALLGFTEARAQWPKKTEVQKRVINMLRIAKKNAAMRRHQGLYENALEEATHGSIPATKS